MKNRFSTYDLICSVTELQKYVGLRVNQIYDIDNKTYLIRLQKTDEKIVLLIESGTRIHTTDFEWPKNVAPSGFSMKLRKHLKNKRLESLKQLGYDRIIDLQFGTKEAAYHIFLELYDRGNIILTDHELLIMNILRPHTEGDKIRFAVGEKYPMDRARMNCDPPNEAELREIFATAKTGDNLKKILNPHLECGPAVLEHVLLGVNLQGNTKVGQGFNVETDLPKLVTGLKEAQEMMTAALKDLSKGYIIQKVEKRPSDDGMVDFYVNHEFHPHLFRQHVNGPYIEYETFLKAADFFFSSLESQKIDMRAINQEKEALKKIENVRRDHDQRLQQLLENQELDRIKAELITSNLTVVDQAILAIRTAIANQMAWSDIESYVKEGKVAGDPVASAIKTLKLGINHITLLLSDPYDSESSDEKNHEEIKRSKKKSKYLEVDVDLDLTAFANARKYYDMKRSAAKKQQKTIESQGKALKSAEKKTKQALKEMKTIVNISKVRKTMWFEKFFWFISTENYLVIGGRDMAQNELIVKRYMRTGDIYVHADIHGGSSVVIKNPSGEPVPPKTLNDAGIMAICYSVAWENKVVTAAWWVHSNQVSKTAPTGEYLTAGSFMIRGKKNYLPPGNLVLGFSFLFRLEENSVFRHKDERKTKSLEDEVKTMELTGEGEDVEIVIEEDDGEEGEDGSKEMFPSEKDESDMGPIVENLYPDTEIQFRHTGKAFTMETKVVGPPNSVKEAVDISDEETIVYLGDQIPVVVKSNNQKKKGKDKNNTKVKRGSSQVVRQDESSAVNLDEMKKKEEEKIQRCKKKKLKKIKEKYKDEDEEDRRIRLEILKNVVKKTQKREKANQKKAAEMANLAATAKSERPKIIKRDTENGGSDEETQEPLVNTDLDMLSSLTGAPLPEDELLYAVPIVAPYSALHNYKYKVKLTPGTGKRGKSAKTAVSIFLKDKSCSPREKDLLKSVKDENLARNFPGKVKMSTAHYHKK